MDKRVIKIEFVLENCEVLEVNVVNCWHNVYFGKTWKRYDVQHFPDNKGGNFFESESTDFCSLTFELKVFKLVNTNFAGPEENAYRRLIMGRDVTSIILHFNDNTEKQIYVPWKGDGFTNKAQHSFTRKDKTILEIHFDYHYYWSKIRQQLYIRKSRIEQWFRFYKDMKQQRSKYANKEVSL